MEIHQDGSPPENVVRVKHDSLLGLHHETIQIEPSRTNKDNRIEVPQPLLCGGLSFVPRCEKEPVKNCTQLDKKLLEKIIQKVATELLCRSTSTNQSGNVIVWNKGGRKTLFLRGH